MELVAADDAALRAKWSVVQQAGLPVAEVHLALCKAGGMAEQRRHEMTRALGIDQAGAKHHEAAALAMHGLALGKVPDAVAETVRRCKLSGVEFRIAAG